MAVWTFTVAERSLGRVGNHGIGALSKFDDRNLGAHACEEHSGKRERAYLVDIFSLQDRQPYPCLREITLQGWSYPTHYI